MEKYTKKHINYRRKFWHSNFKRQMEIIKEDEENITLAIQRFLSEYIYFSKSIRELEERVDIILDSIISQTKNIPRTRNDLDKEELKKVAEIILKAKKNFKKEMGEEK